MRRSKGVGVQFYWNYLLFVLLLASPTFSELRTDARFALKLKESGKKAVFHGLHKHNCSLLHEITPTTFIVGCSRDRKNEARSVLQSILHLYRNKIIASEPVRAYRDILKPLDNHFMPGGNTRLITSMKEVVAYDNAFEPAAGIPSRTLFPEPRQEIDNQYGMGVSKVHELGYTGKGVVVAITDVGIDTGLLDLKDNIDQNLCFNFIDNSTDVTPEYFHHLQDASVSFTAHGDHCASIIGSVRGNSECAFGISFKATIVGLKIFTVTLFNDVMLNVEPTYDTGSDIIARALAYKLTEIDIFSNAWAPTKPFTPLDLLTKEAIKRGAERGRQGLGTIYVVPAGLAGNGFANSIHTIAVNGVGRNWSIPDDSTVSACVITSGLSSGSNITANHMVTASQRNRCVNTFKGVSAVTSQIAAIIALALESNSELTLRQLKRLLIQSSEPDGTGKGFSTNAAGHRFHMVYGSGLLNAERLVLLAKNSSVPLPLLKRSLKEVVSMRNLGAFVQEVELCYSCDMYNEVACLDSVEDVVIKMRLTNYCKRLKMILVSPSGTESILIFLDSKLSIYRDKKIQLTSVHFLDEVPFGTWRLKLIYSDDICGDRTSIHTVSLILYGTEARKPEEHQTQFGRGICAENQTQLSRNISAGMESSVHTTESVSTTREESGVKFTVYDYVAVCVVVFVIIMAVVGVFKPFNYLRAYQRSKTDSYMYQVL